MTPEEFDAFLSAHRKAQQLERYVCSRCRIGFRIGFPRQHSEKNWTRCSEPKCGQRFWHTEDANNHSRVVCGIAPEDVPVFAA